MTTSIRIAEFDTWQGGYGLATVRVYRAGTTSLADIYTDEACTVAADNPQTLESRDSGGISYGKFLVPLYVQEPYQLDINSVDETGVVRPAITTLDDEDASAATVKVTDGSEDIALADHLARRIDVRDDGDFIAVGNTGASAATNTATLVDAIGRASAIGAGYVELPGGTYQITSFTLPSGVVLRGVGRGVTVLQSTFAGNVMTIGGARAGLSRLTLDGVTLVTNSAGLFAADKDQIVLDDVEVKRFNFGLVCHGGSASNWRELYVTNCIDGYQAHSKVVDGLGGAREFNTWTGGEVSNCSGKGIYLQMLDDQCQYNRFIGINFADNPNTAVYADGARATELIDCQWSGNTKNLVALDGSPATADNTIIGLDVIGGSMTGGTIELTGTLESVAFRRVTLTTVAVTLTTPSNNVLAQDCREVSGVTFAGTPTAWTRSRTFDRGSATGITTGNAATKAWAITLDPGQRVYLEGKVVGRGRNVVQDGFYHISVSARRPGASLAYDTQTANFTVGNVLTGATSGATARITADSDSGATGTLTVQDVVGTFVDNEIITDGAGGSATANGTTSLSDAVLAGSVTNIRAVQETNANWAAVFVANGPQIELQVTGDTAQTIEWTADVDVVSS